MSRCDALKQLKSGGAIYSPSGARKNLRKSIRDAFRSSKSFSASDTATPGGEGDRFAVCLCS